MYEFNINKKKVLKGAYEWDREVLNELDSETIIFDPLFEEIEKEIENLSIIVLEEFIRFIPKDVEEVDCLH